MAFPFYSSRHIQVASSPMVKLKLSLTITYWSLSTARFNVAAVCIMQHSTTPTNIIVLTSPHAKNLKSYELPLHTFNAWYRSSQYVIVPRLNWGA